MSLQSRKIIHIQPASSGQVQDETRYSLSDHDQACPGMFTIINTFFEVPSPDLRSKKSIGQHVQAGLEHTLGMIPVFAGKIFGDAQLGQFELRRNKEDTIKFAVCNLENDPSFPSFAEWESCCFSDDQLALHRSKVSPPDTQLGPGPMGLRSENGCPMFSAQLNFIRGGVMLSVAFHHFQGDGVSIDMFMECWAENSRAMLLGDRSKLSTFKPCFDRSFFNASEIATRERLEELRKKDSAAFRYVDIVPEVAMADRSNSVDNTEPTASIDASDSTPETPTTVPKVTSRIYHFSLEQNQQLKQLCSQGLEEGQYLSTYDCVAALIWRAVTRSRLQYHPEWDLATQRSHVQHAINTRKFASVPDNYIGNAPHIAATKTHLMASIIDSDLQRSLPPLALSIRDSILEITPSSIPDHAAICRSVRGKQAVGINLDFIHGHNVNVTSWNMIHVYETWDFGFGLPSGFVTEFGPVDGIILMYPTPKDVGGLDVLVKLEQGCQERLEEDAEFREFCKVKR